MHHIDWGYDEHNDLFQDQKFGQNYSLKLPTNYKVRLIFVHVLKKKIVGKLQIQYSQTCAPTLVNTGHTFQLNHCGNDKKISGGDLNGTYSLKQIHCHWGDSENNGSEHTVNGKSFAGELHLVHWNSTKFKKFEDAVDKLDGCTVIAVLLKLGQANSELQKIVDSLPLVTYKSQELDLQGKINIDITKLLPTTLNYWSYQGSFTTPPFNEPVTWIVLKTPIETSKDHFQAFRSLKVYTVDEKDRKDGTQEGRLIKNCRPVQKLGNRVICEYNG